MAGNIDYNIDDIAGLTQEQLNARILAATLGMGDQNLAQQQTAQRLRQGDKGMTAQGTSIMGNLGRAAQGGLAGYERGQAGLEMKAQSAARRDMINNILGSGKKRSLVGDTSGMGGAEMDAYGNDYMGKY